VPLCLSGKINFLKGGNSKARSTETMKVTHKWLEEFVRTGMEPAEAAERLTMAGLEVEKLEEIGGGDALYDVNVTPNRGDCLSVLGIARELSAITGCGVTMPTAPLEEAGWDTASRITVSVDAEDVCPRYAARVVEGVVIGESPGWLRKRLEAVGIRPVNNVVDVTNYVLIELGQPLHAFDLDRLFTPGIAVRRAGDAEEIVTIDGRKRLLSKEMLVIADDSGPVAIAGVMGGHETEVSGSTRRVLLECANFEPRCVRRTAKKLNLTTESSFRFERGVDFDSIPLVLDRAARLIADIAGGETGRGRVDIIRREPARARITLRMGTMSRVLGREYRKEEMMDIFSRLSFAVEEAGGDIFVRPPSFRNDIRREIDLVEEVARISGYDSITPAIPEVRMCGTGRSPRMLLAARLRCILTGLGLDEVNAFSFMSGEDFDKLMLPADNPLRKSIDILNPVSREHNRMRTTLVPSLLGILATNANRGAAEVSIFEIGRVYGPDEGESDRAGIALMGNRWSQGPSPGFYAIKGIVCSLLDALGIGPCEVKRHRGPMYHPGQAASISVGGVFLGVFGRVHPGVARNYGLDCPVFIAEVELHALESVIPAAPRHTPLPRYPSIRRDIAMIVDKDLPYGKVDALIREAGHDMLKEVKLFDLYRGGQIPAGKKSFAISVIYRSDNKTLTDKEVNETHQLLCELLVNELGCIIRKD